MKLLPRSCHMVALSDAMSGSPRRTTRSCLHESTPTQPEPNGPPPLLFSPTRSWVRLVVAGVPEAAAQSVIARVAASMGATADGSSGATPLVAFGLMAHEAKAGVMHVGGQEGQAEVLGRNLGVPAVHAGPHLLLPFLWLLPHAQMSVVHFAVRKAAGYADPLPNKEKLLLVTGGCAASCTAYSLLQEPMGKGERSCGIYSPRKKKPLLAIVPMPMRLHCLLHLQACAPSPPAPSSPRTTPGTSRWVMSWLW